MQLILTILLGFCALGWIIALLQMLPGMARLPRLEKVTPLPDSKCPSVSILVAGRDEAEKMPPALSSLLAQDYPDYEVVFADDRSSDSTPEILAGLQAPHPHLEVIRIDELPEGWLGKTHALQKAYQSSRGEWLIFSDADVQFSSDVLRRSLALVRNQGWDHLTLLAHVESQGFWEKTLISYFGLIFSLNTRLWTVSDPKSASYVGTGAFQLLRRSVYETVGTHRRLALEVVDDVRLGQLVKRGGFRSGVGIPGLLVRLRWHRGVGNIVRGLTKNSFAVANYRLGRMLVQLGAALLLSVAPFIALPLTSGLPQLAAAIASGAAALLQGVAAANSGSSPLYGLTHPLGALLMAYIVVRSAVVTLWQGGVRWRDTFYPLDQLRREADRLQK